MQYQGLLEGRDDDVLGIGYSRGIFSDAANSTYTANHEAVAEIYYNAQVTPWLQVGPDLQYIWNPGGSNSVKDAVVLGVRAQMSF